MTRRLKRRQSWGRLPFVIPFRTQQQQTNKRSTGRQNGNWQRKRVWPKSLTEQMRAAGRDREKKRERERHTAEGVANVARVAWGRGRQCTLSLSYCTCVTRLNAFQLVGIPHAADLHPLPSLATTHPVSPLPPTRATPWRKQLAALPQFALKLTHTHTYNTYIHSFIDERDKKMRETEIECGLGWGWCVQT